MPSIRAIAWALTVVATGLVPAPAVAASPGVEPPAEQSVSIDLDAVAADGLAEPAALAAAQGAEAAAAGTSGVAVAVDPPATEPDTRTVIGLSEPLSTGSDDVQVVGVSWVRGPDDVSVDIRVSEGGVWGPWAAMSVEADTGEGDGPGERPGTDPFVVTGADDIQVRLTTASGLAPVDPRLDVYSADTGADAPDDAPTAPPTGAPTPAPTEAPTLAPTEAPTAASTASLASGGGGGLLGMSVAGAVPAAVSGPISAPRPLILSRSAWGAVPPSGEMSIGVVLGATIHHTAGTNDYTASQVPAILRGIQNYHMEGRGWSDIGYNFLVDRFGRIWEGRAGGVDNTTRGVHASSFNAFTTGISVIGNFETTTITTAGWNALSNLVAWKLALHGVAASGSMTINGAIYPAVSGHRDVPEAQTACPGRTLYAALPALRLAAEARQDLPRGVMDQDVDGDGRPDLVGPTGAVYRGTAAGATDGLLAPRSIGVGWGGMDLMVGSPSLAGGRGPDLIARDAATGQLRVYHGNGAGGFAVVATWGRGWQAMAAVVAPGDWDRDGRADLLAVHAATGALLLYRGDGLGGVRAAVQIGRGWGGIRSVAAVGDLDRDGAGDLVALTESTGQLILYRGNGAGGFRGSAVIATGLGSYGSVLALGDVTGDGLADVLLRPRTGDTLTTAAGNGAGGVTLGSPWGAGWSGGGLAASAVGWNGAGTRVLLTVDPSTKALVSHHFESVVTFQPGPGAPLPSGATRVVVVGDVTGSGGASVLSTGAAGLLYLTEANGDGTFAAPRVIGQGWAGMRQIAPAGDFDFDGTPDLLALTSSGALLVYTFASDGAGRITGSYQIGSGFARYRVLGVGGWSASSSTDLLAIDTQSGQLRWYQGHGRSRLSGGAVIGSGWQSMADVVAAGDVMGAGNNDLVARDIVTGRTWVYPANGRGGFAVRRAVEGVPLRTGW